MERGPPTTIPATNGAAEASMIMRESNRSGSTTGQQLNKLQSALATLTMTVSSQASAMTAITNQVAAGNTTRDGIGGNRTRTGGGKPKEKHTCPKCKLLLWHKEEIAWSMSATATNVGQDGEVRLNRMRRGGRDLLAAVLRLTLT